MTASTTTNQTLKPSRRVHTETHLFSSGQTVRLKNAVLLSGNVYLITASLPPNGGSPQYRIRNDNEKFERMASEAELELVSAPPRSAGDASVEKLFAPHQPT